MKCKVEGCGRPADYKAAELCQKHYFRVRRNNTTDMVRAPAKPRAVSTRAVRMTIDTYRAKLKEPKGRT